MKKEKIIPKSPFPLFETHCHLDKLKEAPLEELLELAHQHGVKKIVTICVNPQQFDEVIAIAESHENLFTTQGVHPHQAIEWNDKARDHLLRNLSHPKVLAIGEIGLDYHYNFSPPDVQRAVFREHLEIAAEHDLPVIIHSREACDDMMAILRSMGPKLKRKGVIHSFSSSLDLAKLAIELDFYLGFNGMITFKNAQDVREALSTTPLNRLLLETDAPYLTPTPFRGRENAPHYLPLVAQMAAEIKDISLQELIETTYKNSQTFFSL